MSSECVCEECVCPSDGVVVQGCIPAAGPVTPGIDSSPVTLIWNKQEFAKKKIDRYLNKGDDYFHGTVKDIVDIGCNVQKLIISTKIWDKVVTTVCI